MALKNNTWKVNQWYDQAVAGNVEYSSSVLSLYSWGYNGTGELGLNNTTGQPSIVQVGSNTTWAKIGGATEGSSAAIKNDGTLWTWGKGSYGVLGHNQSNADATANKSSPKQLAGTTWNEVAGQQQGMYATKTDGTLWAWGQNNYGQLGHNDDDGRSSPVQVGSDTDWSNVVDSYATSAAVIKTDGTLWTMGLNNYGRLGLNDVRRRSSPTQVGSDTTWSYAAFGTGFLIANKTDGTLWSWGYGLKGTLGHNESPGEKNYSSPVQIGSDTTWATGNGSVSSSSYNVSAIKTDGTLWSWGKNEHGQLGVNDRTEYSSPKQIPGTTWRTVFCARQSTYATKTDGTLWAWGDNNRSSVGLLGQGNTTLYSSPVQIGSDTDWSSNLGGSMWSVFGTRMS